ncbi:hypothetical protein ON010_g14436 [Phytophthora cinnamomi]|nr:hypothetical protein ON010_g14436 [Phytophthora cinnamomi]
MTGLLSKLLLLLGEVQTAGGGVEIQSVAAHPVHLAVVCGDIRVAAVLGAQPGAAARKLTLLLLVQRKMLVVVGQAAAVGVEVQPVGVPG